MRYRDYDDRPARIDLAREECAESGHLTPRDPQESACLRCGIDLSLGEEGTPTAPRAARVRVSVGATDPWA